MRIALTALCLLATAATAAAELQVPDPSQCFVTPCPVFCPSGELGIVIEIRDFAGNAIAGTEVALRFGDCYSFVHCTPPASAPYVYDDATLTVRVVTGADGRVLVSLPMGSICLSGSLQVVNSGVLIASRPLYSPDQDGDLDVDAIDLGLVQGQLYYPDTQDATADFDCDGAITTADLYVVQQHSGHICPVLTGLRKTSWGRIKTIYR